MRLSIEMSVSGLSIDEIIANAVHEWNTISGQDVRSLPQGSEIDMAPAPGDLDRYIAKVYIRTKVEDYGQQ